VAPAPMAAVAHVIAVGAVALDVVAVADAAEEMDAADADAKVVSRARGAPKKRLH
jgi:hypothetical protein